jgi:superfamily II DNA helicase RecQ
VPSAAASTSLDTALDEGLRDRFGLQAFRPGQLEAARAVLGGRDLVAVMPTGAGKSLCFQLPALLLPGTTVVVSPLIALMKDQVDALRSRGIAASTLHSGLGPAERAGVEADLAAGRLSLLYVAPERLGHGSSLFRWRRAAQANRPAGCGKRSTNLGLPPALLGRVRVEAMSRCGLSFAMSAPGPDEGWLGSRSGPR